MEQDTVNFRLILIDKNPGLDRTFSTAINASSSGSTTDSDDEMNGGGEFFFFFSSQIQIF